MASRSSSPLRKSAPKKSPAVKSKVARSGAARSGTARSGTAKSGTAKAGKLPEWNLTDLYSAIDAPEISRDLDRMDAECIAFENDYKGKLAEETAKEGGGAWLAGAVKRYEAIDDLRDGSPPMPA